MIFRTWVARAVSSGRSGSKKVCEPTSLTVSPRWSIWNSTFSLSPAAARPAFIFASQGPSRSTSLRAASSASGAPRRIPPMQRGEGLKVFVHEFRRDHRALGRVHCFARDRSKAGGEGIAELLELVRVHGGHGVEDDEQAHEHRDHVHVGRHPAFVDVVLFGFLAGATAATHAALSIASASPADALRPLPELLSWCSGTMERSRLGEQQRLGAGLHGEHALP